MILLLDNFDSFTFNLVDYFEQLEVECKVVRNDAPLETIQKIPFRAICLSPGPETPTKAGIMPKLIEEFHDKVPMLGICLGHQALGMYFGAKLTKAARPMHGKVSQIRTIPGNLLFQGLPKQVEVVRYHSLILSDLPESLLATARTESGEIMAFRHHRLPLHGLQFHPEAWLTQFGLHMLTNWVKLYDLAG
ncbi:MAG TPA: aminodeoxychorismate/anthranilate synthase component II [Cytophagales bacterium]|nr:aminodeoxychorismate/anthranilate synthase component II [Cytophagales bacterium]HAA23416.1 aminodeoxychorismate/anthranilate synthase component II [Cytophagales bacterium]HAP58103.1 aminodeoxychorismate/anthranilate synthase component II [Cytophagales bacterium]